MTAPFASPSPVIWVIVLGAVVVAIAIPFGRRDDWLGWGALSAMAVVTAGLWAMLVWGMVRSVIQWWHDRRG